MQHFKLIQQNYTSA